MNHDQPKTEGGAFEDIGEWSEEMLTSLREYNLDDISLTRRIITSLKEKGWNDENEVIKQHTDRLNSAQRILSKIEEELKRRGIN
jgi:hypothetical protein